MKKIIFILSLFLICYACYFIYNKTKDNRYYILSVGDELAINTCLDTKLNIKEHNTHFISNDYRLIDLLNIVTYNEESIHELLSLSDILIISIGTNEINYKLNNDTYEIYTYLNNMINNYRKLLDIISRYDYKKVYIIGINNNLNNKEDLFIYLNYKLKKLSNSYNYTYIDSNIKICKK
jgi:hypothetical protein